MANLQLKVCIPDAGVTKSMLFDPSTAIYDTCRIIRERVPEANIGNPKEFGVFLSDEDPRKGVWLESGRALEYYLLRNGDLLEYKTKQRVLRIRMLDSAIKTLNVDDSQTVAQLMVVICGKIGILNHEEYSLTRELSDEEKLKTLTLKRDRSIAKDQKKLDSMKRKLHTDDEIDWLDHAKTLREQSIEDDETLLLRRKLFFSDQNVDARDPIQLNLLYVQTRDAICKGAHPVTHDEAIRFAGYQCQIQFGEHDSTKHKTGFIDLKDFLPKEYQKIKGIEKKIYLEHKALGSMSEADTKVKYTTLARSLDTYGITFFLVKEKMKGKNKMVPRLLGITKDGIIRVDSKTKETIKYYDLTSVRRWAASPNTFTLDLGDYADQFYAVQTVEGDQIANLIAGYIDIIVRKKKDKDYFGIDGDEENSMFEDNVTPAQATIIQHQHSKMEHADHGSVALPAVLRSADQPNNTFSTGSLTKAKYSRNHISTTSLQRGMAQLGMSQGVQISDNQARAQRALVGTIESGQNSIQGAREDLMQRVDIPKLSDDPSSHKWRNDQHDLAEQNVGAQLSAMTAATAQLVTLTGDNPNTTDYNAVGSAVASISSNVGGLAKDCRFLACLDDPDGGDSGLMDAARRLIDAFADLLDAAQPQDSKRQDLLSAAGRVGEASHDLLANVQGQDSAVEEVLLAMAKGVANATAALVLKAKGVASVCDDQNKMIGAATNCALATSHLVACTKVVAPTIGEPSCQEQLTNAARNVSNSLDVVLATANESCNDNNALNGLNDAAKAVGDALADLLGQIKQSSRAKDNDDNVNKIYSATDNLTGSIGDPTEMVKHAKRLAQATQALVLSLKDEAEADNSADHQQRLMAAAKMLADATAKMVQAAKGCASSPQDADHSDALKAAAEALRTATAAAEGNSCRSLADLEEAARRAATAATQCVNSARNSTPYNTNENAQQSLLSKSRTVAQDYVPALVLALKQSINNPGDSTAQRELINESKKFMQPGTDLVLASKAAIPTMSEPAVGLNLTTASKQLASALANLLTAMNAANDRLKDESSTHDIDEAMRRVRQLEADLTDHRNGRPNRPVSVVFNGADSSDAQVAPSLGALAKKVGAAMAQLLTAASQNEQKYTGQSARDTASALEALSSGIQQLTDRQRTCPMVDHGVDVMDKSTNLLEEAKRAVTNPAADTQERLAQVAKAVSIALNKCVNCLPGLADVDYASKQVMQESDRFNDVPYKRGNFPDAQRHLNESAQALHSAASDVVSASSGNYPGGQADGLAAASRNYADRYGQFVDDGVTMIESTNDQQVRSDVTDSLKTVSNTSSKLLLTTRSMLADPMTPNVKNLLTQAARNVSESINALITICTVCSPGQKECDNALRQMQMMRPILENINEPILNNSYFGCLDNVINQSRSLADAMTGISGAAKQGDSDKFCDDVKQFADSVCNLMENSAQCAYLVGISDPASELGRSGLIDERDFLAANEAIQTSCDHLENPSSSHNQILTAASTIAKHTSTLCNICRNASSTTNNPVAKRHFVQSAKGVANCTANLVKAIKMLDSALTQENREACAVASKPLLDAVNELTTFARSPEFLSVPAKISLKAQDNQEVITGDARSVLNGACDMIRAAKQLSLSSTAAPSGGDQSPDSISTYRRYSEKSHDVSEGIKRLVQAIRKNALGHGECVKAIESLERCLKQLDNASLAATGQSLQSTNSSGQLAQLQESCQDTAKQTLAELPSLQTAAKYENEKLGHYVTSFSGYYPPLTNSIINCASKTSSYKDQMALLDQTKTSVEAALQLLYCAKDASANTRSDQLNENIDEAAVDVEETLNELINTLDGAASAAGFVNSLLENIAESITKTEAKPNIQDKLSYVDYQTSMVELAKKIAYLSQEMMSKSVNNTQDLGRLCGELTKTYSTLAENTPGAIFTTSSIDVGQRIRASVQQLGNACAELIKDAGHLQVIPNENENAHPTDTYAQADLGDHSRKVNERVCGLLSALQAGSVGTQACINAVSTVSGIVGDLDTTIMFATAATLNADDNDSFGDHRESILKTAKALVEDTKVLVAGAASSQQQLATAANNAVVTITQLADCVKFGATSLGSNQPDAQVLLINAVKDVATALQELIVSTKNASGKSAHDSSMSDLKDSAKTMVTNVTSLLKTVKSVDDEATRGSRALESSIQANNQCIKTYLSTAYIELKVTPESLIRLTKPLTTATSKAVLAGNSAKQQDAITAANAGRKAISDLLPACKSVAQSADNDQTRERMMSAGQFTTEAYQDLLEHVNLIVQRPSTSKQKLVVLSQQVAQGVTKIVQAAETIKGTDWVDPEDPAVIAEAELLGAAAKIEAAARKLESLKARAKQSKKADDTLTFDDQILEAAKSITSATAALVKAAHLAQKELVAQGRMSSMTATDLEDCSQWSEGLVSAAHLVVAATHSLCDAANLMVQGKGNEEKLISAAKQVASSTAHLLVACRVKADMHSVAMQNLQIAGNAVKRATDSLVKAAQTMNNTWSTEDTDFSVDLRMVGGLAEIIKAKEAILIKERELESARRKLETIRRAKYKGNQSEDDEEDGSAF